MAKNKANAKQHPDAELLLFENYSHSSSTLSSKNNRRYSKIYTKSKCVCLNDAIRLMAMKIRLEMKNRSRRYNINRPRPRYGQRYTKYKMFQDNLVICINQYLSNI